MRINRTAIAAVAVIASLAIAAPALARPTINLDRADAAEHAATVTLIDEWNADIDEVVASNATLEADEQADAVPVDLKIVGFTLDGCDQDTAYSAVCDWTLTYQDGSTNDGADVVVVKRNGRYLVR